MNEKINVGLSGIYLTARSLTTDSPDILVRNDVTAPTFISDYSVLSFLSPSLSKTVEANPTRTRET